MLSGARVMVRQERMSKSLYQPLDVLVRHRRTLNSPEQKPCKRGAKKRADGTHVMCEPQDGGRRSCEGSGGASHAMHPMGESYLRQVKSVECGAVPEAPNL